MQASLALTFDAPQGYTPERDAELKAMRSFFGLPEKTSWGSGQPPAIAFELRRTYSGMHSNAAEFKEPRRVLRDVANLLMATHDPLNAEHLYVTSHPHSIGIAAPIQVVGTRGVDEAWVRGLQVAKLFQQMLNRHRAFGAVGVDIVHYMLPGTTADGYMTAYPSNSTLPGSTSWTPMAGDITQLQAPSWLHEGYLALSGDSARKRMLEAARQAQPKAA